MWLFNSSIGRKFVMSLSGLALIFFLLFHGCMNLALVFSEEAYNMICEFLGANWYALIGTMGLAALVVVHFAFAIWLTFQNRAARGNDRYAVTAKKEGVDWASENMLVLGGCVLGFLLLHFYHFWFHMQFAEIANVEFAIDPANGAEWAKWAFTTPVYGPINCVLYLIWFVFLFLHLNHGVWSALHTLGWNNLVWMKRIKVLGTCVAALVILPFVTVVLYFLAQAF